MRIQSWFVPMSTFIKAGCETELINKAKRDALAKFLAVHGQETKYEFVDLPDLGDGPRGYVRGAPSPAALDKGLLT